MRPLGRADGYEAEEVRGLRTHPAAELLHFGRQLRLGLRNAVLHLDEIHVAVCSNLERHCERIGAIVARVGRHVNHVIHAVHFVLDRGGDGVHHLAGVRAGITVGNLYFRRRKLRILRYRQVEYGHCARYRQHDGYHHRETRTLHKSARERLYLVYRLAYG